MFFDARYAKYDISEHLLLFVDGWLFSPKKGEKHILPINGLFACYLYRHISYP